MPHHRRHHNPPRRTTLALALFGATLAASSVEPPSVRAAQADDLLAAAATAAGAPTPVRADVAIARDGNADTGVILQRGHTRYIETGSGTRALVKPGKVVVRDARGVRKAAPEAKLTGTNIALSDLTPVSPSTRRTPQISDTGPMGTVVTWAPPDPSPYVIVVETYDPTTATVTRTKYYEGDISTLTKLRRDATYTDVAGRPKPTEIVMDTVRPTSTTTLSLTWKPAPEVTALGLDMLRGPTVIAK